MGGHLDLINSSMMAQVKVLQINLHHCKDATAELRKLLSATSSFVCLIQEPWVSGAGAVQGLASCGTLHKADGRVRSRACIISSPDVLVWRLPQFTDGDTATVVLDWRWRGNRRQAILSSVYMPNEEGGGDECPPAMLRRIVEHARVSKLPLIVGGDCNAHHNAWGSTDINGRGEQLLDFIVEGELLLCNKGNKPTFANAIRQEVLDITLSNVRGWDLVGNWRVTDEISTSDHLLIAFEFEAEMPPVRYCRNPRKTDWDKFKTRLRQSVSRMGNEPITDVEVLESAANELTIALQRSVKEACPARRASNKKRVPWWTREVASLRTDMRRKHRQAVRSKEGEDWAVYREARTAWRRELNAAKRQSWRTYCEEIEALSTAARLHRIMKNDVFCQPGMMVKADGTYTSTREEALQELLRHHFPHGEDGDKTIGPPDFTPRMSTCVDRVVTSKALEASVVSFGPYKAEGADGIKPCHLQHGLIILRPQLLRIYKACLTLGYVPHVWRRTRVVFLAKPGKEAYDKPSSFRPISLTSFQLKALERMIDWDIKSYQPAVQHMPNQYAYRAGVSTETALHALVARIERALLKGEFALAIFLDIEGAFNNVTFLAMETALEQGGVDVTLCRWILFMLTQRTVTAHLLGVDQTVVVARGTAQGGVLSPLVWNLVMDTLLREMEKYAAVYSQAFADDLASLNVGIDLCTLRDFAQRSLREVDRWSNKSGLRVNPNKTEVVVFTTKKKWTLRPLTLRGTPLATVSQVKYLGVVLDSSLTWTPHVKMICSKATRAMMMCRRTAGRVWGLRPSVMYWLYTAVVRPVLAYCAMVWVTALEKATVVQKLQKVQRLACVGVTGAFPTTPTAAMEILLDLPPLHIFLKGVACMSWYRVVGAPGHVKWRENPRGLKRSCHMAVCQDLVSNIPVLSMVGDRLTPIRDLKTPCTIVIPSREEWSDGSEQCLRNPIEDTLEVFTDGSRKEGQTGASFCLKTDDAYLEEAIPLGSYPTVFHSEVVAI